MSRRKKIEAHVTADGDRKYALRQTRATDRDRRHRSDRSKLGRLLPVPRVRCGRDRSGARTRKSNLRKYVDDAWPTLARIGLVPGASRDRLTFTPSMSRALAEADFVQENAPERPDFKIKLFAEMDEATPPDSIIASSSSGITMDVMQSACKRPERCVIGHPFNPPHVVPLVEVVGGAKTSRGGDRTRHGVLCVDRQEADPSAQGASGPCRQTGCRRRSTRRSSISIQQGVLERGGRGHRRVLRTGASLGRDGSRACSGISAAERAGSSTSWST